MRYVSIVAVAFALAGCDAVTSGEEIAAQACEGFIAGNLRSPSTYKRIEAVGGPHDPGEAFRFVSITYDADNAFGTPIRGAQVCAFKVDPKTGKFPSRVMLESSVSMAKAENTLREVQSLGGQKPRERPVGAFDCCVAKEDEQAALDSF